jgi:hypothetical protein
LTIHAPWIDPYLAKIEDQSEKLFLEILKEMVKYPQLHQGLAQHSRTPSGILQKIADQYEFEDIPLRLFENPNCPQELINKVLENSTPGLIEFVAINEGLSRAALDDLVQKKELSSTLAERKNLDPDHFIYLWEHFLVDRSDVPYRYNLQLMANLACNPSTPLKILRNIAKYEILDMNENLVESYLLSNPALPELDRAQYALLGIEVRTNVLEINDTDWCPTNLIFGIADFPVKYLNLIAEHSHPGGLLRTDVVPAKIAELDLHAIFNMWQSDQSIFKTLWPELQDFKRWKDGGIEFKYWSNYGVGFTYFLCELDLENEERQYDGDINYHAVPGSPEWIPFQRSITEAIENFSYIDFTESVEWGGRSEWLQAWALSEADPEFITLTDHGEAFVIDADLDRNDEDRLFDADIVASKVAPYGWKYLSNEKKEFLIKFIKDAYLIQENGFYQYAEHFLICICFNPNTPDEMIAEHMKGLNSELITKALEIRGL